MKTKFTKLVGLLLVLTLVCSSLVGCGKKDDGAADDNKGDTNNEAQTPAGDDKEADNGGEAADNLKIALVGPMTGDNAQYGKQFERGVKEYLEVYNAKGGTQVTVDIFDDKNDAKEAVSIANKILSDGGYMAIIGPFSSTCALAMAEVTDEEKLITISPSCSHVDYVKLYDYTFRLSHVNALEGECAAQYIKDTWGSTKVAGIYTNNDWGIGVDEAYVAKCKELGMEVVANESFIQGQTKDFSAALTKLKQAGAEAVYYMGQYTEAGGLLKQIKDMGMDIHTIITTSSYKIETLQLAGDAAKDVVFLNGFFEDPDDKEFQDFKQLLKDKYDVAVDNFVLRAYDAADWLMQAYDKCKSTDPDTLKQALCDVGAAGFEGIGGDFTLNEERNVIREFYQFQWNGKSGDELGFEIMQ
ncbi:ABC transporter substrate-binding protein [Anaerolentibacter hominis]|uniref:ABC transporter substrate-binding protein n=1 Tax=Anaerolentibacter hominis TaxID=3079009 RepID=UPI0031B86440